MKAMQKKSKWFGSATLVVLGTLAVLAGSCNKVVDSPAPPGDNGGVGTPTGEGTTPTPTPMPGPTGSTTVPGDMVPVPVPGTTTATPTPQIETPVTPPPPEVMEAERVLQEKLDGLAAGVAGTKVKFVNCSETPCTTRLEAKALTGLRDLLQAVSADNQGRINYSAREQLDGYAGQIFQADVTLGTDQTREVPSDETQLLVGE
jgi:hypothetical protein